jgi:ABC-type Zn uptake system ZnuABC Zn-binding protein ZnuA
MRASRRVVMAVSALAALAAVQAKNSTPPQAKDQPEVLVLTALPATYAIASSLAEGTHIRVANVPPEGRPMSTQGRYFERLSPELANQLRAADAVVTIGKLWPQDALYPAARAQNIRVVNIDATEPVSSTLTGVALTREPVDSVPWQESGASDPAAVRASAFFWLAPTNAVRAAEIVAQDLARLSPVDADRVMHNLTTWRRRLFDLKQQYEARLAELDDVTVFALAPDFVYLTTDLGIFVDGYFLKQEIEWTPADFDAFGRHLRERGIRVVIHKRDPGQAIREAIERAGATLVVLRTSETFLTPTEQTPREQSFLRDLESNLQALLAAFGK